MHEDRQSILASPYPFPHDNSLFPTTTALVVIDMQRDFLHEGGYLTAQGYSPAPLRAIIPAVQRLLSAFRAAKYPIYFTREGHRPDLSTLSSRELFRSRNNASRTGIGDPAPDSRFGRQLIRGCAGHEIVDQLAPHVTDNQSNGEFVVDKPGRSAFAHTDFELMLRNRGIRNLVICGVTTDVCVSSTMREANDRGFDCLLVEDATAAGTEEGWRGSVESVKGEGGIFGTVGKTEDVCRVILRDVDEDKQAEGEIEKDVSMETITGSDDWDTGLGQGYGLINLKYGVIGSGTEARR